MYVYCFIVLYNKFIFGFAAYLYTNTVHLLQISVKYEKEENPLGQFRVRRRLLPLKYAARTLTLSTVSLSCSFLLLPKGSTIPSSRPNHLSISLFVIVVLSPDFAKFTTLLNHLLKLRLLLSLFGIPSFYSLRSSQLSTKLLELQRSIIMSTAPAQQPNLDRYVVIHVATTCDEHGVYVTKDSAEVIELGWILLDAKNCDEVSILGLRALLHCIEGCGY